MPVLIHANRYKEALAKAIADKPSNIPAGAALFYGMAGGSNYGAVYIVPQCHICGGSGKTWNMPDQIEVPCWNCAATSKPTPNTPH